MSVGNLNTQGDKKNNFQYQLSVLQLLEKIANSGGGGGGGCCPAVVRTPTMKRDNLPGSILVGARSVSFFNAGATNGTVLGAILKPGEMVTFSAESTSDTLTAIAYDGTGTDLLITTLR